jgi:DNA-binding SARP family transcriptional activator
VTVATPTLSSLFGFAEARPSRPISIYTLGGFTVFVNGAPLSFSGKVQKRPLELLRALITLGGCNVPSLKLARILWPDSTNDLAKHALETTLYRLRKLLGEKCIKTHGGEYTLNSDQCWLDLWNLESLLDAEAHAMPPSMRVRRLFQLYRGPFLDSENGSAVLIQRDRLHSKFLRVTSELGKALESRGEHDVAIECYQRSIEIDPLAEDFYRRLMQCYRSVGCPAEALAVYQRCHKALAALLSIDPTAQTTALYREIQGS